MVRCNGLGERWFIKMEALGICGSIGWNVHEFGKNALDTEIKEIDAVVQYADTYLSSPVSQQMI